MSVSKPAFIEPKEQYEDIFEYSPYAIFLHDTQKITNVNQAFLDLYGFNSKAAVIGLAPIKDIVHAEDLNIVAKAREEVNEKKPYFIPSIRVIKQTGEIFHVECHISLLRLGGELHHQVLTRDITESKQVEINLFESELRYRKLFEDTLDGIYKSTPGGRFVEVNQAMVDMLGYDSVEELLSIDIKKELYFKKSDRKVMADKLEDRYPLKRKNGSLIWVEDHSYYEYDEEGNIIFHHGILRDVTSKLEKQIEMQDLLEITEDQNKRLQNFAHIISHNIRSHSSNMSSLVKFMEERKDPTDKEMLFEMLKVSTVKLEETIQNLNEIITVNQNLNKPMEIRNLNTEVNNTLKVLSGQLIEGKVQSKVDIDESIQIQVIPAYLDSILLNLITNAIKYRNKEGNALVHISAELKDDHCIMSVTDNGIGIDTRKNAKKLFRMYETFSKNKESRGFGLYITKNQIEAMKGTIEVESKLGKGSTFKVYFLDI